MAALRIPHLPTTHLTALPPLHYRHCLQTTLPSTPCLRPKFCILARASSLSESSSSDIHIREHSTASSRQLLQPLPFDGQLDSGDDSGVLSKSLLTAAVVLTPMLLDCQDAWAGNGEFGILEGRTAALVHPIVMGSLFVYTLWTGYLGWQWRSVRTIQDEINLLKKEIKPKEEGAPPAPVETKIKELTEVRKELVKGGYRDRHWNAGSILLAFGVLEAVGGCLNTWFRTGKLFPGPHLFAGAGITVLWALAAALVPAMQKGDETARSLHIALNALNVVLFICQIPTGIEIVFKVFEFTTWP